MIRVASSHLQRLQRELAPRQRFGRAKAGPLPNIAAAAKGPMQEVRGKLFRTAFGSEIVASCGQRAQRMQNLGNNNGWSPYQPKALAGEQRDAHGRRRQILTAIQVGFWTLQPLGTTRIFGARAEAWKATAKREGQRRRRLTKTRY